jgi:subtilisin family serine protease
MHVVHDFGWTFGPAPIRATLWCNPGETAGNGVDDDRNGYVDDVHGFDFDRGDAVLIGNVSLLPGGVTHGDLTAAVLAGREIVDTAVVVGIAPGSRWAAVVSSLSIEPGVEWALEQGADTYSMSFSLAGLGELRSHWRRVLEHGALAGLFFVSGAGNFANPSAPNYVPVPEQMRIPEDIPFAVLGVSGVGRNAQRPIFSSQGPVLWRTVEYDEGEVPKPDIATVNTNILAVDSAGRASDLPPNGWSGNSFAGPHIAGVIALMLEANADLTPWQARAILVATARDVGTPGPDMQTGAGVVDAYRAVTAVQQAQKGNRASAK